MLQPKKPKFRKQFKGRMHGVSKGGNFLNFGAFGLKALTPATDSTAKIPVAIHPHIPPTPCTANTSKASSRLVL